MNAYEDVLAHLERRMSGEIDTSMRRRAEYSSDASNYRILPLAVAFPRDEKDVEILLEEARASGISLTARGAGTSCAGNAVGQGIVVDFSRHMNRILDVDPLSRTARVQPGVVMARLQDVAAEHGLCFGPDPSTWTRATFGGMIGNNACGPHAVAYGRTSENVLSLRLLLADGTFCEVTSPQAALDFPMESKESTRVPYDPHSAGMPSQFTALENLVRSNLATIRMRMGNFKRQVSGYALEHLLPENGVDFARFFVGSEGTLGILTEATLRLVPLPENPVLLVLGYPDMPSAADDVPSLLPFEPLAVEGLDAELVDVVRRAKGRVPALPPGGGWLFIEARGSEHAAAIARAASTKAVRICPPGVQARQLWQIRADGAGLAGRTPEGKAAWPGWEDSAVPPHRLGEYLRALRSLLASFKLDGLMYGHFGDGCVHVRIDFPLDAPGGEETFTSFMEAAARLVARFGGSLSGEHGDGRARSQYLPLIYPPEVIALFEEVKTIFDPEGILNPGVLVNPDGAGEHLRRPRAKILRANGGFHFDEEGGDITKAVHRCTGVGNCRASRFGKGFFMCPSYEATGDEKDSTRARARLLQELARGQVVTGWEDPLLRESLDLCLSCKACTRDCPTGIDIARLHSEVLYRAYRGRLRPLTHYTLGNLPTLAGFVTALAGVARLANTLMSFGLVRKTAFRLAGIDSEREMPPFTTTRFSRWAQGAVKESGEDMSIGETDVADTSNSQERSYVLLWADSFSENFDSRGAKAAVELLQEAGYKVLLPPRRACCGLTSISTGQLPAAKRHLRSLLEILAPYASKGVPIVGVEPSCTAVLRSDLPDLLDDPRARLISENTYTLAELLSAPPPIGPGEKWSPPNLEGIKILVQPHCHHYSVMGWETDEALLRKTGAQIQVLGGCCGLAGNFGMERGHAKISGVIAHQRLVPALEEEPDVFLADGFSCRTQAQYFAGRSGVHLAELLHEGVKVRGR